MKNPKTKHAACPAADIIPDRAEMERAIYQAEAMIALLAERAILAREEGAIRLIPITDSAIAELASNTCQRLRAAFFGEAA